MSMGERLLDHDPLTGMKTWFSSSEEDGGTWNIRYEQDCSPILDENKAAQNESFDKRSDMWHAAHIPSVVILEWLTKFGVDLWNKDHAPAVRRLLNSSDYRHLRRAPFRL